MTTSVAATHVIVDQPRTIEPFHGKMYEDAEDWLEGFERVADLMG